MQEKCYPMSKTIHCNNPHNCSWEFIADKLTSLFAKLNKQNAICKIPNNQEVQIL